jgi:hypothetical protein
MLEVWLAEVWLLVWMLVVWLLDVCLLDVCLLIIWLLIIWLLEVEIGTVVAMLVEVEALNVENTVDEAVLEAEAVQFAPTVESSSAYLMMAGSVNIL